MQYRRRHRKLWNSTNNIACVLRAKLLSKHQEYYFLLLFFTVSAYIVNFIHSIEKFEWSTQEIPLSRNLSKAPKQEETRNKQWRSKTAHLQKQTCKQIKTEEQPWNGRQKNNTGGLYQTWHHCIITVQKKNNTGVPLSELTSLYHHSTEKKKTILECLYQSWHHCIITVQKKKNNTGVPLSELTSLYHHSTEKKTILECLYQSWHHCGVPLSELTSLYHHSTEKKNNTGVPLSELTSLYHHSTEEKNNTGGSAFIRADIVSSQWFNLIYMFFFCFFFCCFCFCFFFFCGVTLIVREPLYMLNNYFISSTIESRVRLIPVKFKSG